MLSSGIDLHGEDPPGVLGSCGLSFAALETPSWPPPPSLEPFPLLRADMSPSRPHAGIMARQLRRLLPNEQPSPQEYTVEYLQVSVEQQQGSHPSPPSYHSTITTTPFQHHCSLYALTPSPTRPCREGWGPLRPPSLQVQQRSLMVMTHPPTHLDSVSCDYTVAPPHDEASRWSSPRVWQVGGCHRQRAGRGGENRQMREDSAMMMGA